MQIWIHDNKMKKIVALNNDIPDMLSYTNSSWHSYLDQATSTFDFTIPKFSNGELHEDLKLINDECFVSFYVNGSYQVFYIATLQEDDFNIQLTCNNTNLEYALEYANPFSSDGAQTIEWYLNQMTLLSFAAVEIGLNEISDRKRTLTFDSQETKMNRLQSLMSKFEAEFEFKVELNRDGTYKRIVINIYQESDETHHGIGTDRKDVVLYYSNGLKGVQVSSDKTQIFNEGEFTGKDGLNLADVEISEKNSDGIVEFYSPKGNPRVYAPLSMQRYPATMRAEGQDNWIRKDFTTEYENVNDLKAYALRTLKKYAYPLVTYTASVQSGFVSHYTDLKLGDTIRIIDKNFVGGLALEARVSEIIISFDNPANNSFVFTNYRKLDNKPSSALQTRIEQAVESKLPYRIELATTGGVTFKNNEGETIIKPSLYKGNLPWTKDVTWRWALDGVVTVGMQYLARAENIDGTAVLTVSAYVGNNEVATTEITLTDVDDGVGVESIDRHFTSSDQSDGVTIEGAEWSDKPPAPTGDGKYLWSYDEITYTDGTVTTTKPAAVGANFDVDAFRAEIAEDLKDVPNREEFENKIAEELANSKAEIETQIETAKTQAESNAKEYADTINQETAKVAELANAAADEIKADLVNVKNNLTSTSLVANNAQAAVDAAKQELAEVNTKVDSAKAELTQAKQDLTEVASELNTAKQDLADSVTAVNTKVDNAKAELTQAKQELTNVANDLSQAKTDLQTAVSEVDTKATNLKSDLSKTKQDLASQAQQLQAQANAQTELSKRVTTVETTANGTKTTVNELTKTVAQNGKDITSVTARTKVVEDDLANTKTTLTQVQTTANSTSQKTATLETGLDGLNAKFDSLKIGGANLLLYSADPSKAPSGYYDFTGTQKTSETYNGSVVYRVQSAWNGLQINLGNLADRSLLKVGDVLTYSVAMRAEQKTPIQVRLFIRYKNQSGADSPTGKMEIVNLTNEWQYVSVTFTVTAKMLAENTKVTFLGWELTSSAESGKYVYYACSKLERGNIATDYSPNDADLEQKVAEYKQNTDQNYASLQSTVQNLDGTVQHNKTVADQTAQGFTTRIESLETYKDGETTRANQYFESAKTETARQLTDERTAIAKDYVAKSTYTSDVTGIRNDLTATTTTANTTKQNLANYQASNDRAVANLQSNLQTANGNISSLQTKVEAVPGQITSAVSAVEGKIPTGIGAVNLFKGSRDFSGSWTTNNGVYAEDYHGVKIYKTQAMWDGRSQYFEAKTGEEYVFSAYVKSSAKTDRVTFYLVHESKQPMASGLVSFGPDKWQDNVDIGLIDKYKRIAIKVKITKDGWMAPRIERYNSDNYLFFGGYKLERGNIATDWSPAPEDAIEEISSLSSELKQTKDGITLLATKTELNSAKTELQSGITTATNKATNAQATANSNAQTISTHTTQISALNTGLSAKVSQSDFNTLSGRVTTAENNITAKANELSSKITSVEGKIPTSVGGRNLLSKTNQGKTHWSWRISSGGTTAEDYNVDGANAVKLTRTSDSSYTWHYIAYDGLIRKLIEPNTKYTLSFDVKPSVDVTFWASLQSGDGGAMLTDAVKMNKASANKWTKVSCVLTSKATLPDDLSQLVYLSGMPIANGNWLIIKNIKLEKGAVSTDWSPAPEDAIEEISSLSSEIKQTADGMTLLVTKTELNSAKTELQSGISTATNKANSAQSTANNNAQTISTHTTQISALNTGLSAKVSQTDFNTLSGRVTTAENNITAKANELSSKISSVEGAIEDAQSDITKLSSEVKQTADGMTLLATKTELNTAKSNLQSGISTATNKANAAQSTADGAVTKANNAQSTANSNAQTISTHTTQISALNTGLNAKVSQTDFNTLSGRVTTAENNITAKANELSSKISSVEGKIPTAIGSTNLLLYSADPWKAPNGYYQFDGVTKTDKTLNGSTVYKTQTAWSSLRLNLGKQLIDRRIVKVGEEFTYSVWMRTDQVPMNVRLFARFLGQSGADRLTDDIALTSDWQKFSVTFKVTQKMVTSQTKLTWFGFEQTSNSENGKFVYYACNKLERGNVATGYSPAPEDTATQISSLSSEFKQTTDAIKASVSSLDNTTVKSSSLTINSDGIVMKAGKSTTDVANAIGSYFAVNQNAINLFSDKINVKGNMIVNGAITSDKIASKSINTAHLNGKIITADVISSNAVTANAIKAGAVTTDKMSANSINGDRIAAGTLDAAKIKAGSITASQIASGTITSNQIKAGGISSANIAAGAITGDKIAAGAIDANKIAANAITANMIKGGQLNSINGATVFDLNAGTITFNNDSGYIQRVVKDKIFAIQTWLGSDSNSRDWLASSFSIRKSDNSRRSGIQFQLYNDAGDKPTAFTNIWADSFHLGSSKGGFLFIVDSKNTVKPNWGDIPIAHINGGLIVKDIAIGGHSKSLLTIVEELCKKPIFHGFSEGKGIKMNKISGV